MKALVIGGTGPTGPYLINGLLERGYKVSMLHRGTHESDEIPSSVERIIGDPHFPETLRESFKGRTFDLVIATYGRIRYVAKEIIGKTPRFIAVGGPPSYRGMMVPEANFPAGMPIPTPEDSQLVESEEEFYFSYLVRATEDAVMQGHHDGHYNATLYRYPVVYGPRQIGSSVWPVIRRIQDGRRYMVLPDWGLTLVTRGYAKNVAHAVLLSVDQPETSAGQIYNCGDDRQFTVGQWVQMITRIMDYEMEIIGLPDALAYSGRDMLPLGTSSHHQLMDTYKIKSQLGYKDQVSPQDALPGTVKWCLDNPPQEKLPTDGDREDPLNYEAEDKLVAIYRECYERMNAVKYIPPETIHSYPHPREPGLKRDHRTR